YGENPHQSAGFYKTPEQRFGVSTARQVQGKTLSYNNVNDTDAAFECVSEFDPARTAAVARLAGPARAQRSSAPRPGERRSRASSSSRAGLWERLRRSSSRAWRPSSRQPPAAGSPSRREPSRNSRQRGWLLSASAHCRTSWGVIPGAAPVVTSGPERQERPRSPRGAACRHRGSGVGWGAVNSWSSRQARAPWLDWERPAKPAAAWAWFWAWACAWASAERPLCSRASSSRSSRTWW
ncbi:MAG: hypothetical protein WCP63_11910, partial [Cyanobium sp. ELA712]